MNKDNTTSLKKSHVTRHSSLVTRFLLAFQFLTVLPLTDSGDISDGEIGSATAFFPLVGLVEGALLVISASILLRVLPPELTNGALVLLMVLINGGLHLDGLADTFDAVASRGDKDKKLAIMKDSTVGPIGVIAIVFTVLLKFLALNSLFDFSLSTFYFSLFLMPVLARWTMVTAIFHGKSARQDGLGKVFIEHTGVKELLTATFFTAAICAAVFIFQSSLLMVYLLPVIPALYISALFATRFFYKNLGGMTGDTFGAVNEIATLLFLTAGNVWSQKFI